MDTWLIRTLDWVPTLYKYIVLSWNKDVPLIRTNVLVPMVFHCIHWRWLASFPGSAQLSVACSTKSWAGPGYEARCQFSIGSCSIVSGSRPLCHTTQALLKLRFTAMERLTARLMKLVFFIYIFNQGPSMNLRGIKGSAAALTLPIPESTCQNLSISLNLKPFIDVNWSKH